MLKSIMEFVDVLFPINLGPLTYKCPEHLRDKALPGMLVSAPLKKQITEGIILGRSGRLVRTQADSLRRAEESKSSAAISGDIKEISDIHGESPLLEAPMLKLLNWVSEYYIANRGIALKNMLPQETFKKVKARKGQLSAISHQLPDEKLKEVSEINKNILSGINEAISEKEYKTFLLHAPALEYEAAFISRILEPKKNAIILVPEIVNISRIAPIIREIAGERLCILHSGLSKGQRSEAMEKIISGQCSIVLGTRMAVFAPLKNLSLIAVMHEHSSSYKTEEGLRFNARDIAVMRGYLEKSAVVLSSICPSIESFYNARCGKYTLLKPTTNVQRPAIRIINMRQEKQISPNLSKTVVEAAASAIYKNEKTMFVINRKGYSMLTCKECGHTETCGKCGIPLMFHKGDKSLRCHYCGAIAGAPDKCRRCRSFSLEPTGSGIERAEENIKKIFGIEPLRIDSDTIKRKRIPENISDTTGGTAIILGTKLLTKRLHSVEKFKMAAVLNADSYLNQPDFRSAEKTYQEISAIADKIRPDGRLFVQTRMPQNYVFKFIRSHDYAGFCEEELAMRKAMSYPPYSKLAVITFKGKDYDDVKLKGIVKKICEGNESIEILGPSVSLTKKGSAEYALLIKTASKEKLHLAAREILKTFAGDKNLKVNVAIDA